MDQEGVSTTNIRDSFMSDEEKNECDDRKTDDRNENENESRIDGNMDVVMEVVRMSNGVHESISCKGGGRPNEGDDESNSDADVCSDACIASGCDDATLRTESRLKTNGELQAVPCCADVSGSKRGDDDDVSGSKRGDDDDDDEPDESITDGSIKGNDASTESDAVNSKIMESNNQLLELMEFLRAPTDCSKNVRIENRAVTTKDGDDSGSAINNDSELSPQSTPLNKSLIGSHSSPNSEVNKITSTDHDLISKRNHFDNTLVIDSDSNKSNQVLSLENQMNLSPTMDASFNGCEINSNPSVVSVMNKDDSNIAEDRLPVSEVSEASSSQPPHCSDGNDATDLESVNKNVGHVDVQASSPTECFPSTVTTTCLTSTISLPPSHRPFKKRIGLENILMKRLLHVAKPVNHHSTNASDEEQKLNLAEGSDIAENLTSLESVQVLTDHPQSITVLQSESDANRTLKEILEQSSIIGEDQMSCDDAENNSKRMHKRKCSSPHRIVKKSLMIKTDEDDEIEKESNVSSPQMSPTPMISKPIPSAQNQSTPLPSLVTTTTTATTEATSTQSSSGNIQIPQTTKISSPPNAVPFMPGLSMNVITITPDENYVEPPPILKQKPPPLIKPLRQLAPKSSSCAQASPYRNTSNNILTSKHATPPTNVIPISLVQSTTNPSLVILVNNADTKCAQFISAQPFQFQAQLAQQRQQLRQQVPIAEQIKSANAAISNIVPGLMSVRPFQAQQPFKSQTVLSQSQQKMVFPQTTTSVCSNSMPKLKVIADKSKTSHLSSSSSSSSSSNVDSSSSGSSNLENFFEPFRNNCIVGKFVAPVVESSKLSFGDCSASSERFTCVSCGCVYSSETALKGHYERKSFLVTFHCSCRNGEVDRQPSTFYNLCSFSKYYRHHVLQHPYVPHSPANSYKVTCLPEDQLSDECLKLMKDKSLAPSQEQTASEEPSQAPPSSSLLVSEPFNAKREEAKQTLQCKECKKEFRLPLRIKQHFQNKVAMKPSTLEKGDPSSFASNKCSECDIILPSSCSFKAHSRLHNSSEPYVCPECGLTFSTFEVMKEHAYNICYHGCRKAGIKGCRFCNFVPQDSTSFSESLDLHITKSHKSPSLKCKFCPETFKDAVSVHKHCQLKHGVVINDGDIQIMNKCPVCELQMSSSLEKHLPTHSVESKSKAFHFSCPECNKNFAHRAELEKHLRGTGHLSVRVNGFVCKLCTLTFPSREDRCNHIMTEHPSLKDMFFSEINNYDLPAMPLIGRRDVVSPSNLFAVKSMPNLRPIDPQKGQGVSSCDNIQESKVISSSNAIVQHSPCHDVSRDGGHVPVTNSDGVLDLPPPERWECSRCNEIFVNKATFQRHQQKHLFLEQNKSRKRKLNANDEMPSNDKVVCKVTESVANTAGNIDAVIITSVNSGLITTESPPSDVSVGNDNDALKQSSHASVDQELEEDVENDCESGNASSIDLTEHKASLKYTAVTDYKSLPHLLQQQQLQQLPELFQHLPPHLKSSDRGTAEDALDNKWHSCQLCCMSFKSSSKLGRHVAASHEGLNPVKPETYTCTYCPDSNKRVFLSTRHLHRHLKVRHKIIRCKSGQYMSLDASKMDVNHQKGFTSPDTRDGEDSSAEGKCSSEPFPMSPFSEDHGNANLDDSRTTMMDVDDDGAKDPDNVRSRKIFGNSDDTYNCSYCDHSSSDRSDFWEHIVGHEGSFGSMVVNNNKIFQCPECGSMFVVRTALFRHLKLVHRVFSEEEYENELDQFKSFRAKNCKSIESESQNDGESVSPKTSQGDLPADKLAKLAAIRSEDIHNVANSPQTPFFAVDASSDDLPHRRKGLRSQIKSDSTEFSSNADQGSNSSGEIHDPSSQNECQVCYRSFDSQIELKVHMRVHGMAFIQGTRRSSTNVNQSSSGEISPTQTATNLKAIVA